MATDNPRAVDDLTLSKSKKRPAQPCGFLFFSCTYFNFFSRHVFVQRFCKPNHEHRTSVGNLNLWLVLLACRNTLHGVCDFYCLFKIWQY